MLPDTRVAASAADGRRTHPTPLFHLIYEDQILDTRGPICHVALERKKRRKGMSGWRNKARGDIRMVELRSAPNPSLVYRIFARLVSYNLNKGKGPAYSEVFVRKTRLRRHCPRQKDATIRIHRHVLLNYESILLITVKQFV